MADNQYITIMLQSLQKKEKVLNSIIQINKRQKEELENPSLDPDDFDKTVEEKSELIKQLELLDNGFEKLYEKVREELQANKEIYQDEILKMQGCIRTLTDRSMEIQAQEARNKQLMEQKFASVKKQVKEIRSSQKVVNQYYKNMMKKGYVEPHFLDNKKQLIEKKKKIFFTIKYWRESPIYKLSKENYLQVEVQAERTAGRIET